MEKLHLRVHANCCHTEHTIMATHHTSDKHSTHGSDGELQTIITDAKLQGFNKPYLASFCSKILKLNQNM